MCQNSFFEEITHAIDNYSMGKSFYLGIMTHPQFVCLPGTSSLVDVIVIAARGACAAERHGRPRPCERKGPSSAGKDER